MEMQEKKFVDRKQRRIPTPRHSRPHSDHRGVDRLSQPGADDSSVIAGAAILVVTNGLAG